MPRNVRKQNHFATLKKPWTQLNAPFQTLHFHFAALTHAVLTAGYLISNCLCVYRSCLFFFFFLLFY
jgi:hypothetical protein